MILLCDQYSKNCFRDSGEAMFYEDISLELSIQIVKNRDMFNEYSYGEKIVILMPMMYSEEINFMEKC